MAEKLRRAETGEAGFSRLEATLVTNTEVVARPNSRQMNDVHRHAQASDFQLQNELDFEYSLDGANYPLENLQSLQQVFDAVQCHKHLSNHANFSGQTEIDCLEVDDAGARRLYHLLSRKEANSPVQNGQRWMKLLWTSSLGCVESSNREKMSDVDGRSGVTSVLVGAKTHMHFRFQTRLRRCEADYFYCASLERRHIKHY